MERTIAIIGAGPAGLSASIQLSRFGISHFIFERSLPGGLLRNGNLIGNYTGLYPPVSGLVLSEMMISHFESYSQKIINSSVTEVHYDPEHDQFHIKAGESVYVSDYIIAASGTKPIKPEVIKNLPEELMKNIYFEITTLADLSGKQILIVGGGDCAFDYSLTLGQKNEVEILNRSEKIKALKIIREMVLTDKKISYRSKIIIGEIYKGVDKPLKVKLINGESIVCQECDIILFAIGREPDDIYLSGFDSVELDTLVRNGKVHLAGDIKNREFRQAVIAAGNGIESAMKIFNKLNGVSNGSSI
ncbi:MAG: NAD(P)/FAD-dependent oxidoreductase [Candidatus Aminicenantes bacterium]|nr:NAD(P)/FAD-dependent oxidoreductase [Candidatus Aminicenantes bacterium]